MSKKNLSGAHPLLQHTAAKWPHGFHAGMNIEAGLSGGLDSVVLLHVLSALQPRFGFVLRAVHVHHGLNANADEWADFCCRFCQSLNVPLRVVQVNVDKNSRLGIEGEARKQRYQVFSDGLSDVVALAHHQNDQIETFMLAALRGGGLRALSAMPELRPLNGRTRIWRPLLDVSRQTLEHYAAGHGLDYVEDGSNQNPAFLRNWLRHHALPQWRGRVPDLDNHIAGSVRLLQNELSLLEEIVSQDAALVCTNGTFDTARWKTLSEARRRQQLLHFARQNGLGTPSAESIADFSRVLAGVQTASAEWRLPHGRIYAYHGRLFAQKNGWEQAFHWLEGGAHNRGRLKNILPENGFTLKRHSFGLREEVLDIEGGVRAVSADDAIELTVGRKNVWKILQECRVPPFARKYWPVVTDAQNRCIAIANIWVNVHYGRLGGLVPSVEKINSFVLEPK